MAKPEGQKLIRDLAARSDVLVENFKVGGLRKYGLDYQSLKAINPRLVYCSITGFGQSGPYAQRAGYDFMIQGMAGLMSINGERDDLPGGGPQKVGVAVSDLMTGMYAAIGILAAVMHARNTGLGQHVDCALLDTQVAALANLTTSYFVSGKAPGRMGNAHLNIVPYQTFATADGYIIVAVGNDRQFTEYCRIIGVPDLPGDPRFATNKVRVEHRRELEALLIPPMKKRTTAEWVAALEAAAVPVGPINNLDQVFADPQVQARRLKIKIPRPDGVETATVASPIRLSETPVEYKKAPPTLGDATDDVLSGVLGLNASEIETLRGAKTVG
jgi:crotonobetainyl-CoA:carnitine CoA-transferase CaiB-like acyl-CoA transferase